MYLSCKKSCKRNVADIMISFNGLPVFARRGEILESIPINTSLYIERSCASSINIAEYLNDSLLNAGMFQLCKHNVVFHFLHKNTICHEKYSCTSRACSLIANLTKDGREYELIT